MKTPYKFLLIISGLINLNVAAQNYISQSSEWYYTYDPDITLDDGYQKIKVRTDTLIGNKNCKPMDVTNLGYSHFNQEHYENKAGNIILYEEDSIVYYQKDKQFHILYNYKAQVNDTFSTLGYTSNCSQQMLIKVDSISQIRIENGPLKRFHISINDSVKSYYTEYIGYPDYFLPIFDCTPITGFHHPGPLRCYLNAQISYSSQIVPSCDHITGVDEIRSVTSAFADKLTQGQYL